VVWSLVVRKHGNALFHVSDEAGKGCLGSCAQRWQPKPFWLKTSDHSNLMHLNADAFPKAHMVPWWLRVAMACSGAGIRARCACGTQLASARPQRFFPLSDQRVPPAEVARRGRMMIKWNIRHREIMARFSILQSRLIIAGGGAVQARLACHSENMHVTMNRWSVATEADVHTAVDAVRRWADKTDMQTLCACSDAVQIRGLRDFKGRVFYLNVQDGGAIGRLYASAHTALEAAGVPVKKKRGGFAPHITVCKASNFKRSLLLHEFLVTMGQQKEVSLGHVPLEALVLACKVDGDELNPPEIFEIPVVKGQQRLW